MNLTLLRRSRSLWLLALALSSLALVSGVESKEAAPGSLPADGGFEEPGDTGFPEGWAPANWGPEGSGTDVWWTAETAYEGRRSLRAEGLDDRARPGATGNVAVAPGYYELRFYARTADGQTALVRAAVGGAWSAPVAVGDGWTGVTVRGQATGGDVELALQSCGGRSVAFFDSVSLVPAEQSQWTVEPDRRPPGDRPRMLYLSGNPHYLADTAGEWASRGFAGFSCAHLMRDWADDIWAVDGDPGSTDGADTLLGEVRQAVCRCEAAGLTDNALLVGLYTPLPDPLNDAGYATVVRNLGQAARFCQEAGLRLLLIDSEYAAAQFDPGWPGYDMSRRIPAGLAVQLRERWREVGRAVATEAPELDVALTPEGVLYYGTLWTELLAGLLEGLKTGGTQGRVHVFCQGTYSLTGPAAIRDHAEAVRGAIGASLTGEARELWQARGRLALGAWPLGYYRPLRDQAGKITGWSGRRETFGDRPVGAFADKSANCSPEQFRLQLAAIRSFSDTYCFVYGHGSGWWQATEEQARSYAAKVCPFPAENYRLPTVSNISEFYQASSQANVVRTVTGGSVDGRQRVPAPGTR